MSGSKSDIQNGLALLRRISVFVCLFTEGVQARDDLPVDHVCSRSRGALSAGPVSPLQSAPVSYPVSSGTGSESSDPSSLCHIATLAAAAKQIQTLLHVSELYAVCHSVQKPQKDVFCLLISYLNVLRAVHLVPLLLQLLQNPLQGAFHRRLWHFLLRWFLVQLRAEAFGQCVAALTGQRWQVLFRLHQLVF